MDLPTRATNSSHAASSHGPAQRQTTSCKDNDEYRVGRESFAILIMQVAFTQAGLFHERFLPLPAINLLLFKAPH